MDPMLSALPSSSCNERWRGLWSAVQSPEQHSSSALAATAAPCMFRAGSSAPPRALVPALQSAAWTHSFGWLLLVDRFGAARRHIGCAAIATLGAASWSIWRVTSLGWRSQHGVPDTAQREPYDNTRGEI